jgi:ABC-type cobalamin/Fe3+-siderophores transport system ATPase subunit
MIAIDAKNVTKLYKIPTGKVTAIVGSNGSGKSTLLRTMARLLKPTAGTVYLNGHDIAKLSTKEVVPVNLQSCRKDQRFLQESLSVTL